MSDLNQVLNSIIDQRRQDDQLLGRFPSVPPPGPQTTYSLNPGNPARGDRVQFYAVYPDMPLLSNEYPVGVNGVPENGSFGYAIGLGEVTGGVTATPEITLVVGWVASEQNLGNNQQTMWTEIGKKTPKIVAPIDDISGASLNPSLTPGGGFANSDALFASPSYSAVPTFLDDSGD